MTVAGAPSHVRFKDEEAHTTSQSRLSLYSRSIEVLTRHASFLVQAGQSSEALGGDDNGLRHIESQATQRQQAIAAKVRLDLPTTTRGASHELRAYL